MKKEPLILEFDNRTIKHLGISLYSTLPPVIAELIANSYDAYAKKVSVFIQDRPSKSIIIKDDGEGMNYDDLKNKYLEIGRDRREGDKKGKRKPIGKKGLGKLAGFGIAREIIIDTVKNSKRNTIRLVYSDIISKKDGRYLPEIINDEKNTKENDGTTVTLIDLKRKSPFNQEYVQHIGQDLAKRFSVFGKDFTTHIIYNNDSKRKVEVINEMKFDLLDIEFEWKIPLKNFEDNYEFKDQIIGRIVSTKGPVFRDIKGIYLLSRGKLVNQKEFFGSDNQDYAFTHITGWLSVDFIEDFEDDVISTNRESLNWETEETIRLREYLTRITTHIKDQWREWRKEKKVEELKRKHGLDILQWIEDLPTKQDRTIAKKIVNIILQSSNLESDKATELIRYVQGTFEFESFKHYAGEMANLDQITSEQLISLMHDWQIIEAREIYNLSKVRIEAIKNLEKHINDNALEVTVMQKFFKDFSWILDPRIMKFENEIRYSTILKTHFKENKTVPERDKRLDFLCVNHLGQFFIIELKRPQSVITQENLNQAIEYRSFIESHLTNEHSVHISCYIMGGKLSDKPATKSLAKTLSNAGEVIFKPYEQILKQAKTYHQEFIDKYEKMKK